MKNNKRTFVLIEAVLMLLVIVTAFLMVREKNGQEMEKISVIIQNSEDSRWAAFKYGLKMAAQDTNTEMVVVTTGGNLTLNEEKELIEQEIQNRADAVIIEPKIKDGTGEILMKFQHKIPIMLIGETLGENGSAGAIPLVKADDYEMGAALARELLNDYSGMLQGKHIGIFSKEDSKAVSERKRGFEDSIKESGACIEWSLSGEASENEDVRLENQPAVDFVIAFDDRGLIEAGKYSASNNLHGALVYGIGHSTEAIYYLDTKKVECLIVPDEFSIGYQSLTETAKKLKNRFYNMKNHIVDYTVLRQDNLFSKENQEIIFTMSQ